MTLTVPFAGTSAGRAAQVPVEAPQDGAVISQFGETMAGIGRKLTAERLDLQMGRLQVDMTRDLGQLRQKYEKMGDPAAIDAAWPKELAALKAAYMNGTDASGAARVDPRLRDRFALGFDDLANRHALAIGAQVLALQRSQRVANYADYQAETANQAATADPATRDAFIATHDVQIDALQAGGDLSPEDAQKAKQRFRSDLDAAAATAQLSDDPAGVIEQLDAGEYAALGPEGRARLRVQATGELQRQAAAAAGMAKADEARWVADSKAMLKDGIAIIGKGARWSGAAMLDDPRVQTALPDEVAEARGAIAFQDEGQVIERLPLAALVEERAKVAATPVSKEWQAEKLVFLDKRIEEVRSKTRTDAVGFWVDAAPDLLPPLELSAPDKAAASFRARIASADNMAETGHLPSGSYLSDSDRAALKPMLDASAAPETRLQWAMALTAGTGAAADRVAPLAGASPAMQQVMALLADGVAPQTVLPILRGETKLAGQTASAPPLKDRQTLFNTVSGGAFADDPKAAERIMAAAEASYADSMGTIDPEDIASGIVTDGPARQKYLDAVQIAMGASPDANGEYTIGGLQEIDGRVLPLPRGVGRDEVAAVLDRVGLQLAGLSATSTLKSSRIVIQPPAAGAAPSGEGQQPLPASDPYAALRAASLTPGAVPDLGENPTDAWSRLHVEPAGNPGQDAYVLVGERNGRSWIVTGADGREFYFSLAKLADSVPR